MNNMETKLTQEKEVYLAPNIQMIEIEVEKGFAQSGSTGGGDPGAGEAEGGF